MMNKKDQHPALLLIIRHFGIHDFPSAPVRLDSSRLQIVNRQFAMKPLGGIRGKRGCF